VYLRVQMPRLRLVPHDGSVSDAPLIVLPALLAASVFVLFY
jgi:hypothetical protein